MHLDDFPDDSLVILDADAMHDFAASACQVLDVVELWLGYPDGNIPAVLFGADFQGFPDLARRTTLPGASAETGTTRWSRVGWDLDDTVWRCDIHCNGEQPFDAAIAGGVSAELVELLGAVDQILVAPVDTLQSWESHQRISFEFPNDRLFWASLLSR